MLPILHEVLPHRSNARGSPMYPNVPMLGPTCSTSRWFGSVAWNQPSQVRSGGAGACDCRHTSGTCVHDASWLPGTTLLDQIVGLRGATVLPARILKRFSLRTHENSRAVNSKRFFWRQLAPALVISDILSSHSLPHLVQSNAQVILR